MVVNQFTPRLAISICASGGRKLASASDMDGVTAAYWFGDVAEVRTQYAGTM
jgi:hypothetical protein